MNTYNKIVLTFFFQTISLVNFSDYYVYVVIKIIHVPNIGSVDEPPPILIPADLGFPPKTPPSPNEAAFVVVKVSPRPPPPLRRPGKALKIQ